MNTEEKKKNVSHETLLTGGPIYKEDIEAVIICMNEALQRWKKNKKDMVTTNDIMIEKGYQIISKTSRIIEDIINIRSFIPRYIRIMRKAKKSEKEILKIKKIINDFIGKFKINRIN